VNKEMMLWTSLGRAGDYNMGGVRVLVLKRSVFTYHIQGCGTASVVLVPSGLLAPLEVTSLGLAKLRLARAEALMNAAHAGECNQIWNCVTAV